MSSPITAFARKIQFPLPLLETGICLMALLHVAVGG